MAGHSHWKNIKRKKEAADRKKALAYSKAAKMIISAIRQGGTDINTNSALRAAIEYAKSVRMPKENIERLLNKYSGENPKDDYQTVIYEILGPSNLPMILKVFTDNTNRTLTELKTALHKLGGRLADKGSLLWQFEEKGALKIEGITEEQEDRLLELLDLVEVDDFMFKEDFVILYVAKEKISEITSFLQEKGYKIKDSRVVYRYVGNVEYQVDKALLEDFINELRNLCTDIEEVWYPT